MTVSQVSNRSFYVAPGDKLRKKSTKIANALALELANYGIEVADDLLLRICQQKKDKAAEIAQEILSFYTIGTVNPPLFRNWEQRTYFSFGECVIQLFGYVLQISGNDLEDPNYMDSIRRRRGYKKSKTLTLSNVQDAQARLQELVNTNVVLDRATFDSLVSLAYQFDGSHNLNVRSDQARVAVMLGQLQSNRWTVAEVLELQAKKPADVLRLAACLVNTDHWNLPSDVKYASVGWQARKAFLNFLAGFSFDDLCEAMGNNRGAWEKFIRHFKVLKQSEFRRLYPGVCAAAYVSLSYRADQIPKGPALNRLYEYAKFYDITEGGNLAYRTFASRVQSAIDAQDFDALKVELDRRPAYLFRNIATVSHVVSKKNREDFVQYCRDNIERVPVNVLLSLIQIDVDAKFRIIDSKGQTTVQPAEYNPIIGELQGMAERAIFKKHGVEGKIEVADDLKNRVVPFLSTNAELDRGSRIPFENKPYLYFLMHWVQSGVRTDLDHSYMCFDDEWNGDVIYFGRQANSYISQSGDITNAPAPDGGTEYGRINLNQIPSKIRYIVPVINVYTGDEFSNNEVAYAGFQFSDSPMFELQRKHVRYDLSQPAQANIPFVIDVRAKEIIILDYNQRERYGFTANSYKGEVIKIIEALKTKKFMTMQRFADLLSGEGEDVSLRIVKTKKADNEIEPSQLQTLVS